MSMVFQDECYAFGERPRYGYDRVRNKCNKYETYPSTMLSTVIQKIKDDILQLLVQEAEDELVV